MKRLSGFSIAFLVTLGLIWFYRGYQHGLSKYINETNIELHYKVVYKDKTAGHSGFYYVFRDGRKWEPADTAFSRLISVGDSIVKESRRLRYVIYKSGGPDSTVYVSTNK
jgi:hypothetical protein